MLSRQQCYAMSHFFLSTRFPGPGAFMAATSIGLNRRAVALCDKISARADTLQVERHVLPSGTIAFDFSRGGLSAGQMLARVCAADLAEVSVREGHPWPQVHVTTKHPIAACMASQYAGWEIKEGKYFAMGSGPMRAAVGSEPLFEDIGFVERADHCVGVLETAELPPDNLCRKIATKCGVAPARLTLLFAPTHSVAGSLQVVARSIETSLHKLH